MKFRNSLQRTIVLFALGTLTACGGGGSSDDASEPPVVTMPPIETADTTAPVITLNGESTIEIYVGDSFEDPGAAVTDNNDTDLEITISGEVDTNTLGTYQITYQASDAAGNEAEKVRTITVISRPLPDIEQVTIQAQDYVDYYDSDAGNTGGAYRNDDVDIEATSDTGGQYNVGWTVRDEWLEYEFESSKATYVITARVASEVGGGKFRINVADKQITSENLPKTSGWQTYSTEVAGSFALNAGQQRLRLTIVTGDFNLNWLSLDAIADADFDGVGDEFDKCPQTLEGAVVNEYGCPDTDSDGVDDSLDLCPDTPVGDIVDANGCTVIQPQDEVAANNNILVGGADSSKPGFTLYVFDNDQGTPGSVCNDGCADNWPPLRLADSAASGVANLSTITRGDGSTQITHDGRPLYFYVGDSEQGQTNGNGSLWHTVELGVLGDFVSLYNSSTVLAPIASFIRTDGVAVTRLADRGRDRHAKDITFQDHYDHFLAHYWEYRTARIQLEDYTALDQSLIRVTWITEAELGAREFRVWYNGITTTGQFNFNPQKEEEKVSPTESGTVYVGRGTWNNNFEKVSEEGHQFKYTLDIVDEWQSNGPIIPLATGRRMEFEASQFLLAPPAGTRLNYYGTTFLYITGEPGIHPFEWDRNEYDDSYPIPEKGLSGGATTLGYNYSEEPAGRFMGMATNMSAENAQPWVEGRRVHHTNFETGEHDERNENIVWTEQVAKAGPRYINQSCANCHIRNGRALVSDVGEHLDKWVFKIGDENGEADPLKGRVLQPEIADAFDGIASEGNVSLGAWTELENGLRSPNYVFTQGTPVKFSARIAPQLVGMGLLDAITETDILQWHDPDDADSNGISGRVAEVVDPVTGDKRIGRFGYKASASSLTHQISAALNTDIGVMTSVLPEPDCGSEQLNCGDGNAELDDVNLNKLVKYVALLGVPARRDYDVVTGENLFEQIGCVDCHRASYTTSLFHPMAELRNQTIYPYTDMLLHDMGEGLADSLADGTASGAEWRTAPLWGLGLSAGVMVRDSKANDSVSLSQSAEDINRVGYLHDGRARTIEEAILWHGGEAQESNDAYQALNASEKAAILAFLNSL